MSIRIPIISEFDDKGIARAKKEFGSLETTSERVGYGMEKAFVPAIAAAGALAAGLGMAAKAAAEDEAAQAALAVQLQTLLCLNSTTISQDHSLLIWLSHILVCVISCTWPVTRPSLTAK